MNTLETKRDELQAELDTLKGELQGLPEGGQRADRAQAYLQVWGKLRRVEAMIHSALSPQRTLPPPSGPG